MLNAVSPQLPDWLTHCAETMPEHLAIQCGSSNWSFAELARQVEKLAGQLATIGVVENSRVALLAPNGLVYVAFVHALTRLGAILVPLNTRLTTEELHWQLNDVHAILLVSEVSMLERARTIVATGIALPLATMHTTLSSAETSLVNLSSPDGEPYTSREVEKRPLIDLDATQVIMYTSGTTGHPKGVLITYGMQWWNAIGSALNLGHDPQDCWLACLPLFHIGGLSILMRSVIYGIRVVLLEKFDEVMVNRAIRQDGVTIISVVAVMLQRMLTALDHEGEATRYPSTLRCALLGGGPAPRPLLEKCASKAIPVAQTYGLTESCSQAVTLAPADALRKLGSAGRPLLPVQLQIMDESSLLPTNKPGVIYLKGPTITPGYADHPEATAWAFSNGWFSTGDIGYLDEDGYLYVLDRRSDLIISGGENIYPAEVESALLTHPAVAEAGVCGRDDPQWGQVPIAFIKLYPDSSATSSALLEHVRQRLARYKVPHALYFVQELPRNSSGKLLRRELPMLLQ
ncbi:MAG TPA: o-succinylbenzoate--CoA ligase [Ktedonobacteraceae bacterium]|nr:o-succinylbenzoate--CoA ligase [Ktedonobacteraceae bacterium]